MSNSNEMRTMAAVDRQEADDAEQDRRAGLEASVLAERVGQLRQQLARPGSNVGSILRDGNAEDWYFDQVDALIRAACLESAESLGHRVRNLVDALLVEAARDGLDDAITKRMRSDDRENAVADAAYESEAA